ncbi:MAG: hypothetical protein ACRC7S_08755 [Cetobacterium sp.]
MKAFNKKKKPKHTTKPRYKLLRGYGDDDRIRFKFCSISLTTIRISIITESEFYKETYHQSIYKLKRIEKSRLLVTITGGKND